MAADVSDQIGPEEEPEDPPLPETTNLTDPKQQRRARDRVRREAQENESLWRAVLAEKAGRRELWRLIAEEGRAFNTEFACGPNGFPQPEATWHNLGRQQWALRLYHDMLRIDPDGVRLMHAEHDARFIVAKTRRVPE